MENSTISKIHYNAFGEKGFCSLLFPKPIPYKKPLQKLCKSKFISKVHVYMFDYRKEKSKPISIIITNSNPLHSSCYYKKDDKNTQKFSVHDKSPIRPKMIHGHSKTERKRTDFLESLRYSLDIFRHQHEDPSSYQLERAEQKIQRKNRRKLIEMTE